MVLGRDLCYEKVNNVKSKKIVSSRHKTEWIKRYDTANTSGRTLHENVIEDWQTISSLRDNLACAKKQTKF